MNELDLLRGQIFRLSLKYQDRLRTIPYPSSVTGLKDQTLLTYTHYSLKYGRRKALAKLRNTIVELTR